MAVRGRGSQVVGGVMCNNFLVACRNTSNTTDSLPWVAGMVEGVGGRRAVTRRSIRSTQRSIQRNIVGGGGGGR